jgi:copper chaperone CopZ
LKKPIVHIKGKGKMMKTVTYEIPNINCQHCVHTIKTELEEMEGMISVAGDVDQKTIHVEFDAPITEEQIQGLLKEINYPVK